MNIWSLARRFSISQLFRLSWLGLQQPLCIQPTIIATKKTLHICNTLYGNDHHNNGKANAFRHALWNVLICVQTLKVTGIDSKSIYWTQKVTDLHEKLMPNEPLEEAMDLHNNQIGRALFSTLKNNTEDEIIQCLQRLANNAVQVSNIESIAFCKKDLVYLSKD